MGMKKFGGWSTVLEHLSTQGGLAPYKPSHLSAVLLWDLQQYHPRSYHRTKFAPLLGSFPRGVGGPKFTHFTTVPMQTNKDNSLALSSDTVRDNKLQVQVRCD